MARLWRIRSPLLSTSGTKYLAIAEKYNKCLQDDVQYVQDEQSLQGLGRWTTSANRAGMSGRQCMHRDVARSHLRGALIDGISTSGKLEVRVSELVIEYTYNGS